MKLVKNILSRLPKARSGRMEVKKFSPSSNKSPVQDAVQLTSSTTEGGHTTIDRNSTKVRLKNGSSLESDSKKVQVRDEYGLLRQEFDGQITVSPERVDIEDRASRKSQIMNADGTNILFDEKNGLIVCLDEDGGSSMLRGKQIVPLSPAETPSPILKPEGLMADHVKFMSLSS